MLIFGSDLRKKGVCSKSATKMLHWNKFLVSECIFKLACHCESCRLSETGCTLEISLKHLWKDVTVSYLKKPPELFCTRRCSYRFYIKTRLLQLLFKKVVFHWNLQNFSEHLFLKTTVSSCNSLFTVQEKETANEA